MSKQIINLEGLKTYHDKVVQALNEKADNSIVEKIQNDLTYLDVTVKSNKNDCDQRITDEVNLLIPRRLKDSTDISLLPTTANRQEVYLFVDNNGEDAKITLSTLTSTLLRTVSEEPNDLQVGEYIFLQI